MRNWWLVTSIFLSLGGVAIAQSSIPNTQQLEMEVFRGNNSRKSTVQSNQRNLRLTITVDSPDHLKVQQGETIKRGEVIADNSNERDRLARQRKSVKLQIANLSSKKIPTPFKPKNPPPLSPLPPANFLEENSAIKQAELRLQQAKSLLESRNQILKYDNPQVRAIAEEAEAALRNSSEKVIEQEELIKNMEDMKLDSAVLRHEQAKLLQLQGEQEQKRSLLDQAQAKIQFAAIEQQQEIQRLETAVQLAESNLQIERSRLESSKNNRQLLEYRASLEATERVERENQSKLSFSQQQQRYAQSVRDKEYQLAQLQLSLTAVDDKLSQIPVVRSPRNGYIRRIKPWVGRDGRYTTTITITSSIPKSE